MKIVVNMLIEWDEEEAEVLPETLRLVERVVDTLHDGEQIALMNIYGNTGFPVMRLRQDLCQAYDNGSIILLTIDPYSRIYRPENEIPENQRKIRDDAWKLVGEVLQEAGKGIYREDVRGKAVKKIAVKYDKHEKVIYSYLRKCWQRGWTKNSLLPAYYKCGGRGKRRLAEIESATKLGRPSSLSKGDGEPRGIRITPRIEKLFEKGIKKFYLNNRNYTFKMAYEKMLFAFFHVGVESNPVDGVEVPILPDKNKLPTENQFRYWYNKYYKDRKKEKVARQGEREFNLNHRELIGNSTSLASGPGAVFMIDATIADVYLVSSFDRKRIIGRPVVYLVIDVFSRMIVGFSVSLEGPSWRGATLALDNMIADKDQVCAEYGIKIQPEEWNCHYLPEAIFADRGEFEGYNADVLVYVFGTRIHNTSPYRGDLKAIVERHFGIANEKFIKFLPGRVNKRKCGEKPHALDAKLTLYDFRELLITHILDYNANHELTWYRPDEHQIADRVPLRPTALWNWGIRNRSGHLKILPREIVRLNLLQRKEVSLYQQGIHFYQDIFYLRPEEVPFGKKSKIIIAYDPNCLDVIYLPSPDGKNAVVCPLTPACEEVYRGRTYEEVKDKFAHRERLSEESANTTLQSKAVYAAREAKVTSRATQQTDAAWATAEDQSDRTRLKGIRQNRKDERDTERIANSWHLGEPENIQFLPEATRALPPSTEDDDEKYVAKPSYKNLLDKVVEDQQK